MAGPEYVALNDLASSTLGEALPVFSAPERVSLGDRIGVDVQRLGAIASMGGFYPDVALHAYQGETTKTNVMPVGGDGRGLAYAGAAATVTASLGRAEYNSAPGFFRQRAPLSLLVNTAEISQRIDERRALVRDPNSWVPHIEVSLREGLRQGAWQHLVKDPAPTHERTSDSGMMILSGLLMAANIYQAVELNDYSVSGAIEFSILFESANVMKLFLSRKGIEDPLYSLVPFRYVDRAAIVSARTRSRRPLVKALK